MTKGNTPAFACRSLMETIKAKNSRGENILKEHKMLKKLESEIIKYNGSIKIGNDYKLWFGKGN